MKREKEPTAAELAAIEAEFGVETGADALIHRAMVNNVDPMTEDLALCKEAYDAAMEVAVHPGSTDDDQTEANKNLRDTILDCANRHNMNFDDMFDKFVATYRL